ncbi:MAG: radical SAM protein [Thermoanaerobaculia bacterium]|nr:radical SAM protein [Thermoanaerobaculia bacterium]
MNVLIVGPEYRIPCGWTTMDARHEVVADLAPLTLSTLKALTPGHVHVDLWDEPVKGRITDETVFDRDYDFVGVTGYSGHIDHAIRIASVFRKRGVLTGVGGPGVSVHPRSYREHFDVLFIGESEETWPEFLSDLAAGEHRDEYRQITKPSLEDSPAPDWDGIDCSAYAMGTVQTTRGCPFDCDFCDVIYLFGRKMRHKPVERVLDEIRELARRGFRTAFITDDEFVGDRRYTKELLRGMRDLNRELEHTISFSTQATTNASKDPELLELAADGGMTVLFIGIESINPETLKNINKKQNLNKDLVAEAHRMMSYGIALRGNTIIGFDEDDSSTFGRLFEFHQTASIPVPALTILQAPHGTPLWRKMVERGQVVTEAGAFERGRFTDNLDGYYFNTIPRLMTRVELMEGYRDLYVDLFRWKNIKKRNTGWMKLLERPPQIPEPQFSDRSRRDLIDNLERRSLLNDRARHAIDELTDVCREVAPSLWHRLTILLTMQAHIRRLLSHQMVPSLAHQIELESSGSYEPTALSFKAPVPLAFRRELRSLLPPVYRRLHRNLDDPDQLHPAITRVFVDFLVRWGAEFDKPEEYHLEFLNELSDKVCAEINGVPPEQFEAAEPDPRAVRLGAIMMCREDILHDLDLELGFAPDVDLVTIGSSAPAHGAPATDPGAC